MFNGAIAANFLLDSQVLHPFPLLRRLTMGEEIPGIPINIK